MTKLWAATVGGWGERPWRTVEVMICKIVTPYGGLGDNEGCRNGTGFSGGETMGLRSNREVTWKSEKLH
jgi:hypothetical protein